VTEINSIGYLHFVVPAGWKWVRIRQIATDRGQAIPDADFTYIDVTAINKERGCIGEPVVISASEAPSRARKVVQKGDVIHSCVRPYLLNIAVIDIDITPRPIASTAFAVMNGFGLTMPHTCGYYCAAHSWSRALRPDMRGQAYRSMVQMQCLCNLRQRHVLTIAAIPDLAPGFVANHVRLPSAA
jgi:type I restriction enzyme S subunit